MYIRSPAAPRMGLRIKALFLNNTASLHTAVISWETYHVSCSTWCFPIFGHRKIYITQLRSWSAAAVCSSS